MHPVAADVALCINSWCMLQGMSAAAVNHLQGLKDAPAVSMCTWWRGDRSSGGSLCALSCPSLLHSAVPAPVLLT
jgi:hypothetical protein